MDAETAEQVEQLFADVMADLPMPHGDLAAQLGVAPSTVWRWKTGKGVPTLELMLQAVGKVQDVLDGQVKRASSASEALHLVQAIEEQQRAKNKFDAGRKEAGKLKKLLGG